MARYKIIDFLHLAHRTIQGEPLHTTVMFGNEPRVVNTTVPNYTIKNIYNYSGRGEHFVAVCHEGGASKRKAYFKQQAGKIGNNQEGYKGDRERKGGEFFEGVNLAINLMFGGDVAQYRIAGLEADDMISSLVKIIQSVDRHTPIDIITNDSDMLPLVDDQVSVYMRATRQYAEAGCPEHHLYYQVTPRSWSEYLGKTSQFGKFYIPFNSMLLYKMIRGDKSDGVDGSAVGYGPKKYSALMEQMVDDKVDFQNTFRYGVDFDLYMRPILLNYFDLATVNYMKFIYTGICLEVVPDLPPPRMLDLGKLQMALNPLKINMIK
jgi:hypothetical protein